MAKIKRYPAWIYQQSGVLAYRWHEQELQVLLISSRSGKRWVLPKGIVEPGMTPVSSARKEALEEAGVEGDVGEKPLGRYRFRKWGGTCEVEVYALRLTTQHNEWPEFDIRRRRWFSIDEAVASVNIEGLREIIAALPQFALSAEASHPEPAPTDAPPRLIYLLRHAKSSWADPSLADYNRPLAPRGIRACKAMTRYLRVADVQPDRVVCSTAVRAVQTFEGVRSAVGDEVAVRYYRGLYLAGPQTMLHRLQRTENEASSVMLIAHNPGMHSLALRLIATGNESELEQLAAKYPTGALVTLIYRGNSWSELAYQSCELHSYVRPRDLTT